MTAIFRYEDHVLVDGDLLQILNPQEAMVLGFLAKVQPRVAHFERLISELWPLDDDEPKDAHNHISVIVGKLRPKLEPFGLSIASVKRTGYFLVGNVVPDWSSV